MSVRFIIVIPLFFIFSNLKSQTFRIEDDYQAKELVDNHLLSKNHDGIKIKNISYSGMDNALGLFQYKSKFNDLPASGIVLSSGKAKDAMGPNDGTASNENHAKGDIDLSAINNLKTFDSSILEFDFMSLTDSIRFVFQFASEEYPEYVKKGVSDIFGFFIKDLETKLQRNIAVLPNRNTPITIDLINNEHNSDYYIANNQIEYKHNDNIEREKQFYENNYLFQFDGYTKPITTGIRLKPYQWYHFKIAIADIGDRKYDSWIFLKGNSFISDGRKVNPTIKNLEDYYKTFSKDSLIIESKNEKTHILLPIYFNLNSSEIKLESAELLDYIYDILDYSYYDLQINGYADESGTDIYNLKLSQERADQVKEYFRKNGIDPVRLKSKGKGEIKSSIEMNKSRKVEFILYKKGSI